MLRVNFPPLFVRLGRCMEPIRNSHPRMMSVDDADLTWHIRGIVPSGQGGDEGEMDECLHRIERRSVMETSPRPRAITFIRAISTVSARTGLQTPDSRSPLVKAAVRPVNVSHREAAPSKWRGQPMRTDDGGAWSCGTAGAASARWSESCQSYMTPVTGVVWCDTM